MDQGTILHEAADVSGDSVSKGASWPWPFINLMHFRDFGLGWEDNLDYHGWWYEMKLSECLRAQALESKIYVQTWTLLLYLLFVPFGVSYFTPKDLTLIICKIVELDTNFLELAQQYRHSSIPEAGTSEWCVCVCVWKRARVIMCIWVGIYWVLTLYGRNYANYYVSMIMSNEVHFTDGKIKL